MCYKDLSTHFHHHIFLPYLAIHRWKVPDITHYGPAGHHSEEIAHHVVLCTVPESISKLGIILRERYRDRDREHGISNRFNLLGELNLKGVGLQIPLLPQDKSSLRFQNFPFWTSWQMCYWCKFLSWGDIKIWTLKKIVQAEIHKLFTGALTQEIWWSQNSHYLENCSYPMIHSWICVNFPYKETN